MKYCLLFLFASTGSLCFSQELVPYRLNNLYGFADENAKIMIQPEYEEVGWFDENGNARVKMNNQWGIINKKGEWVVNPDYTQVFSFKEGLAAICTGGQLSWIQGEIIGGSWGFIDEKGVVVISPRYHRVENFYNGCAIVQIADDNWGNWGVIDKTGKQILPFKYATYSFDMRPFPGIHWDEKEKGKLWYRKSQSDETWVQIDLKGNPTGKKITSIHGEYETANAPVTVEKNGKYALKSSDGKMLTGYDYDYGIYFYEPDEVATIIKNGKYGVINKKGIILVEPQYDHIDIAGNYLILKNNEKYALTRHHGKLINDAEPVWQDNPIAYLGENIFSEKTNQGIRILSSENYLNEEYYEVTGWQFKEGLLKVMQNKKWGFIDTKGKVVIECKYPYVDDFENGFSRVDMNPNQYKIPDEGYINKKGVEFFHSDKKILIEPSVVGSSMLVNEYGEILKQNVFFAQEIYPDYIYYKENGHVSVINKQGQSLITDTIYELFTSCPETDPDLNQVPDCYYAGLAVNKVHIYDGSMTKIITVDGSWSNDDFTLFVKNQKYIERKDQWTLKDLRGNSIGKSYSRIYATYNNCFVAYGQKDSSFILNQEGKIISPINKQIVMPMADHFFVTANQSKSNQYVEIFDYSGKKINQQPIHLFHQSYSTYLFYFLENTKTKKKGYYWNGILKEAVYDNITTTLIGNSQFAILENGGKISLFDSNGKKAFSDDFESIQSINQPNSYAVVRLNGKYGVIGLKDNQAVYIIKPKYDHIPYLTGAPFLFAVKTGEKYVYINEKEEVVIDKDFSFAENFSDQQFAFAYVDDKAGAIDYSGKWIVDPKYKNLAYYTNYDNKFVIKGNSQDNKTVLFNEQGKSILPAGVDSLDFEYLNNYNYILALSNNKMGIINFNGRVILPSEYDEIKSFYVDTENASYEFFSVRSGKGYGFADVNGIGITTFIYEKFEEDDESYIAAMMNLIPVKRNGKYGAINLQGEEVVPCEYSVIDWYAEEGEGKCIKMKKDGKWGLFGVNGKMIFTPQFDKLEINWEFTDNFSDTTETYFYTVEQKGKKGIVTSTGKTIFPCEYSEVNFSYDCMDGRGIELKIGKNTGIASADGKIILAPKYKSVQCNYFDPDYYFVVETGKQFQVLGPDTKPVNDHLYDSIDWMGEENLAVVYRNKQWFYLNVDGSEVLMEE